MLLVFIASVCCSQADRIHAFILQTIPSLYDLSPSVEIQSVAPLSSSQLRIVASVGGVGTISTVSSSNTGDFELISSEAAVTGWTNATPSDSADRAAFEFLVGDIKSRERPELIRSVAHRFQPLNGKILHQVWLKILLQGDYSIHRVDYETADSLPVRFVSAKVVWN
jgi:hypothetical protein